MEKIYMEEQQQKNQKQKQQQKKFFNVSVVLSFVVAIFAITSLAAFGIANIQGNGVSYAAPAPAGVTGDTFTFNLVNNIYGGVDCANPSVCDVFTTPMLSSDAAWEYPIFCVEKNAAQMDSPLEYRLSEDINDYGFLYILNNSMVNGNDHWILRGLTDNRYVEAWATQVAIWLYQSKVHPGVGIHEITDSELNIIKSARRFSVAGQDTVIVEGVYAKIEALVNSAVEASGSRFLTVSKASGEISKSNDGKYYISPLITVTGNPPEFFQGYDISLSGVDGAIAIDENGNELALTGVSKGTNFYVRVPVDKVTQAKQTLAVNVP